MRKPTGENRVHISALTGEGTDRLLERISELLDNGKKRVVMQIPYSAGGLLDTLHRDADVLRTDYLNDCIEVEAVLKPDTYGRMKEYITEI